MPKRKIIFGIVIILIITGGWLLFLKQTKKTPPNEEIIREENEKGVMLIINYGGGEEKSFNSEFRSGITVFDLLKEKTGEANLTLKEKVYDLGIFIEAIGDKENGQDGKYWMYYVNGEMPMLAADKMKINPGDKIEFKFEEPSF